MAENTIIYLLGTPEQFRYRLSNALKTVLFRGSQGEILDLFPKKFSVRVTNSKNKFHLRFHVEDNESFIHIISETDSPTVENSLKIIKSDSSTDLSDVLPYYKDALKSAAEEALSQYNFFSQPHQGKVPRI